MGLPTACHIIAGHNLSFVTKMGRCLVNYGPKGLSMKNFLTTVSMTLILLTAAAVSAYCGNANGEISGPLSGVRLSVAKASIMVLAQAKPESSEADSKQNSDKGKSVFDGMLVTEIAGQDSQGNSVADDNHDNIGTPPIGTPGTGDPVPGCTNGKAVGNKHCVSTPSE
jgi:hypothetical protein